MCARAGIVIVLCTVLATCSVAQPTDTSSVRTGRLALVGGLTLATMAGVHFYQQQAWWLGPTTRFHLVNDWEYSQGVDKVGHLYGTVLLSESFASGLRWSGVRESPSVYWGSAVALAFQLFIEAEDGFHAEYGFSVGDAAADIVGAAWPVAQHEIPFLRHFNWKWSYFPSKEYLESLREGGHRVFIDDYAGQKYWLAMNPRLFRSGFIDSIFPNWLGLAVGYGVRGAGPGVGNGTGEFYLAFDYRLNTIFPGEGFLPSLFSLLDYIHFPAPGIALRDGKIQFGIIY